MISIHVADGVAQLTMSAPPLNILTRQLLRELRSALDSLSGEPALRALVVAAEGKHFSAGASVPEHMPAEFRSMLAEFEETILTLYDFAVPVIASVQGRCLGGAFELVQAADLIVAADDAQFGQPEICLGVMAPVACVILPGRIGAARAAELLYSGDPISASRAAEYGLVARITTVDALRRETLDLANRIARHSAAALRVTKQALRAAAGSPVHQLATAHRIYADRLMTSQDAVEGLQAFVEKRQPQWSHQ